MKKRILSMALAMLLALLLLPFGALAAERPAAAPFKLPIKTIMGSAHDGANGLFYDVDGDAVPELLLAYALDEGVRGAAFFALQDGRAQALINTDSLSLARDLNFSAEDYSAVSVIRNGASVQIMAMRHQYYEDVVDAEYGRLFWELGEFWLFDYAGGTIEPADHWSYRLHEVADGRYFDGEGSVRHNGQSASAEALFRMMDQITMLCTVSLDTDTDGVPIERLLRVTEGRFIDVEDGEYYAAPVDWAVRQGVTNGTSLMTFSPEEPCTRGQVVTFLWRAAGRPEPKIRFNPFSDVRESDYFCKAVLWAAEQGITNGMTPAGFGPDVPCTRAHVVTFLWRAHEKPAACTANPFSDVPAGEYYTDAVLWAVSQKITNGLDATHFGPDKTCLRGQIVTFLYRDLADPNAPAPPPDGSLRLACGGEADNANFAFGRGIADLISAHTDTDVNVVSFGSEAADLDALDYGDAQLCLCRADVAFYAFHGTRLFSAYPPLRDVSAAAAVYEEPIQILTTDETIHTAADLRGKTVAVGERGSALYYNAIDILRACGLSEKTITYVYLDPVKAVEAMKTGDLCTAFILDSTDFRARAKLSDLDCSLVSMDETHVDALIAACPYYRKTTYETVTDDGTELHYAASVCTLLLARNDVADADVVNILSTICSKEIMAPMAAQSREAAYVFQPGYAGSVTFLPYHPGAARWFGR